MKNHLSSNLELLRRKNSLTQEEMASMLDLKRTTYINYEKAANEPDIKTLLLISGKFGVTVDELLKKKLPLGKDYDLQDSSKKGQDYGQDYGQDSAIFPVKTIVFTPKVITVDRAGDENILYVPAQARAGYLIGFGDPEYLSKLQAFSMPGLRNGTFRMFDVSGPSMAPTVGDNDKVIGRFVESIDQITDDRVYIVVTKDGIVLKRVLNRVSQRGKIVLKSDTIAHRSEYKTYEIPPDDILEIWYAYIKISADFSAPMEIYQRVNDLESDMIEQRAVTTMLMEQMDAMQKKLK